MCGICGWYNKNKNLDLELITKMNNIAKHRGPDDEGYILINESEITPLIGDDSVDLPFPRIDTIEAKQSFLAFGHRRLSIIDLTRNGHQPMVSEDGMLSITFNGEIFNYIEIRKELEEYGYLFHTSSDTEVVLNSYKKWGDECVDHFNGMWAFAIYDKDKRRVFCSRDRLGAKPFYYFADNDNFIFASEIKQLLQNPIVPHVMNEGLLVTHMMWGISDFSSETLIKDIKCLKGGECLAVEVGKDDEPVNSRINVYSYWDIDKELEKNDEYTSEAFKVLEDAIKIRTRSDVPIGIMLSGGLDSSTLVAEISHYYQEIGKKPSEINTYTSCYKDFPAGDELKYAHEVNEYCGTTENLVFPDENDTLSVLKNMIWHMEGLVSFNAMGSFMTLKEISKKGAKVIINGQGADETMFGYERYYTWYLMDVFKRKGLISFAKELINTTKNCKLSIKQLLEYLLYFNIISIRRKRCRNRMAPYVSNRIIKKFDRNTHVEKYLKFSSLEQMQYNEIRGTQLTHILRGDDRGYMAFSMESRVPFIDYRFIEAASQIPSESKIQNGYTKYLLRKNVEGKLPADVVWRKNKMGWPSPRKRWIERLDKRAVKELIENAQSANYFNMDAIRKKWDNDPQSYAIEVFLGVELFIRLFDIDVA